MISSSSAFVLNENEEIYPNIKKVYKREPFKKAVKLNM